MNTNQLKKFAKEARIKLITQIGVKLDFVLTQDTAELRGKSSELAQLRSKLNELGREQLIETVAYTWFNRLMALRFMDANGYNTPKVVTPLPGMSNPEILQNALAGNVEEDLKLDRQRLNDLIDGRTSSSDAQTEAFKILLVASCNKWHTAMPFMFERISDYTELLLPDDLLSDFSIVSDIKIGMSDEDCQQEELIGWLYQFYISDKKDDVFEGLKKNIKITAENIPAATQLFTPRWIVRYMVENTLGKLWLNFKPESKLRNHMPYFIEAPESNIPSPLPDGIKGITDITFLDPCQGSGHVLVYAFDLLSKIYEEEGYNTNEIPSLILENNLFGIDIDERAAQLAAFALTMKARNYYSRFLRNPIQPNVIALENVDEQIIKQAIKIPFSVDGKLIYDHRDLTLFNLTQADNLGSLIKINPSELKALQIQNGSIWQSQEQKLKKQAEYLSRQYYCVVTNPPYLGQKGMNESLKKFIDRNYLEGKSDLMTSFMMRCGAFIFNNCSYGMINLPSWLFLSSFEELRGNILKEFHIDSLLHMGRGIFGIDFGSVAFVISKSAFQSLGSYFRLHEKNFQHIYSNHIEQLFLRANSNNHFQYNFDDYRDGDGVTEIPLQTNSIGKKLFFLANQNDFLKIPGSLIGYWLSPRMFQIFKTSKEFDAFASIRQGMATSDNGRFVRFWSEVAIEKCGFNIPDRNSALESKKKWFPYNKGGSFRKWFGNIEFVVNWENDGHEITEFREYKNSTLSSNMGVAGLPFIFKPNITWSKISAGTFSVRYIEEGFLFDVSGCSIYEDGLLIKLLGLLNSKVITKLLSEISPTLNYEVGHIKSLPILNLDFTADLDVNKCVAISMEDWSNYEIYWGFKSSPILRSKDKKISNSIIAYEHEMTSKFFELHFIEEKLNKLFINHYSLQDELLPDVRFEHITVLQRELERDQLVELNKLVKRNDTTFDILNYNELSLVFNKFEIISQFISYSIGCFFGRFSLDKSGFVLANNGESLKDYLLQITSPTFMPDEDNIIPVLDGEWFNDDIVGRFKVFLNSAFGEVHSEENLRYIEETIGNDIRKYFVKDFYNDHVKRYKKRPIYWMFSSPKSHFKALIYMHRYQPDLCSKMLNDYLQPFISKLEAAKQTNTLLALREDVIAREKTLALKEVDRLELMIRDCKDYERTLFTIATQKITIDLDDGVKVNYLKFKDVLVPIKGLEKEED